MIGTPEAKVVDNGPEFAGKALDACGLRVRRRVPLHRAWQVGAERLHRELQREVQGRVFEGGLVREHTRGPGHRRSV